MWLLGYEPGQQGCASSSIQSEAFGCEDRVLDGPASGGKGSKGGPYISIVIRARE